MTTATLHDADHARATARRLRPTRFLRAAWLVDAAGSAATGLGMLALATPLAGWTGLPPAFLVGSALLFVPYVVLLVVLGRRDTVTRAGAAWPVALNVAWGAACVGAAVVFSPPTLGLAFLAVHVAWGLGFAALQFAGMRSAPAA